MSKRKVGANPLLLEAPFKSWWSGDPRVELFMKPVTQALERNGITGTANTDIYNRAYEAVYRAIVETGKLKENL